MSTANVEGKPEFRLDNRYQFLSIVQPRSNRLRLSIS